MAHEIDFSNNRANMAYTNEVPWHGLGQHLEAGASLEEWAVAAGFDWEAVVTSTYYKDKDGDFVELTNKKTLLRSDTQAPLSVVSDLYKPVQPKEVLEFFREFVSDLGGFEMETAGCLRGGRKIWALAKSKDKDDILIGKKDVVKRNLLLATSFDLSLPTFAQQTGIRVVCANTLGAAFMAGESGSEKRIKVSHLEKFDGDKIKKRMMLDKQWAEFANLTTRLAKAKVTDDAAYQYFYDLLYPESFRETSKRFFPKGAERQTNRMMEIYHEAPGQDFKSAAGTAWGLVNSVTYWVDHEVKSVNQGTRLDKAWFGKGHDLKIKAVDAALAFSN